MLKTCRKCKRSKPIDHFYAKKSGKHGISGQCKECELTRSRAYFAANRTRRNEVRRMYHRKHRAEMLVKLRKAYWLSRDSHRAYKQLHKQQIRKRERRYYHQTIEKFRARAVAAVHRAIISGRIKKQPCVLCGSPEVEAHHDDYARRLEVRWLCKPHHRAWHRVLRATFGGEPKCAT